MEKHCVLAQTDGPVKVKKREHLGAADFMSLLFYISSVGPSPELVRRREAKWINIMVQWNQILPKRTNKVHSVA